VTGLTESQMLLSHLAAAVDELQASVDLLDPAGRGIIGPVVDLIDNYAAQVAADLEAARR
jgi:hypothetical protein